MLGMIDNQASVIYQQPHSIFQFRAQIEFNINRIIRAWHFKAFPIVSKVRHCVVQVDKGPVDACVT